MPELKRPECSSERSLRNIEGKDNLTFRELSWTDYKIPSCVEQNGIFCVE